MTLSVRLSHRLGTLPLDVTFTTEGGVCALFGRSGAGKTSVVQAVAGLLRPDSAEISLDGDPLTDTARGILVPPHRRRIGYVFQDARLFPHLNVRKNLLYGARRAPKTANGPAFDQVVEILGIGALLPRAPTTLSGGEAARVAIGRALLARPRLLLMDEPLAALDAERRATILPFLERLRDDAGVPILLVSHDLEEVTRLAETVVLMDQGQVVATGSPATVLSNPLAAPVLGPGAGATLPATVRAHDPNDALTRLDTPAGALWVPLIAAPEGAALRLHVHARDITLARRAPEGLSALNILPARVTALTEEASGVWVSLNVGAASMLARITRRSSRELGLAAGSDVHAILKSVSIGTLGGGASDAGSDGL